MVKGRCRQGWCKISVPGLVDASVTGGVMVAATAEIGQGLGQAFWRGLADVLACLASAPSALVVLATFPFGLTMWGIIDEREMS